VKPLELGADDLGAANRDESPPERERPIERLPDVLSGELTRGAALGAVVARELERGVKFRGLAVDREAAGSPALEPPWERL
jgi:hypothetical protein